jgi:hypothetical protein
MLSSRPAPWRHRSAGMYTRAARGLLATAACGGAPHGSRLLCGLDRRPMSAGIPRREKAGAESASARRPLPVHHSRRTPRTGVLPSPETAARLTVKQASFHEDQQYHLTGQTLLIDFLRSLGHRPSTLRRPYRPHASRFFGGEMQGDGEDFPQSSRAHGAVPLSDCPAPGGARPAAL